ncbi:Outer membrane receptor proteins, mostly Fe transport [Hymenobacter daecheongensis DSM 21074]|uniref:Outer membrane receptor proteins, mostly Fe transport n=1 Tax=Hymenobacter daecheongensis DSM 21074 TaxID=1121955 RepID=A0A1M6D7F5_9BACT|nr:TonB-dependent receptor [Hymenobacter daecheongensis]SHI69162.1 Outer membrane receptor proteins, mostly Fe transport [Hymenobacter daecheongensis DSM 21074]
MKNSYPNHRLAASVAGLNVLLQRLRATTFQRPRAAWRRLVAGLLCGLLALPLAAQNPAFLRGFVADSASGQRLPGVGVQLLGQPGGTATDALGNFRFGGLAAGTYAVQVTALGYAARPRVVLLQAGETRTIALALPAVALSLREVTVSQPRDVNQSLAAISHIDQALRPLNSAQDLLQLVPGLFIAQHAGGGKAEQIFLRGFDVDHGTDFAVSIDGLPVNMVSHAHGQGYADFHFVIPETVDQLRVYKGPYTARFGDFATAGAGDFTTKTSLERSQVKLELGQFDTRRAVVLLNLLGADGLAGRQLLSKKPESAYVAAEYSFTNSYFDAKQHFNRFNGLAKYTGQLSDNTSLMLLGSHFASRWDASGQVPERGVREGLISRFGSIDPTEGGRTSRTNATAVLTTALPHDATLRQQAYYSKYDFSLYSNFTFFLQDPVNGDGINQTDDRHLLGYTATYERDTQLGRRDLHSALGVGTRNDFSDLGLRHTVRRSVLDTLTTGRLYERNVYAYLDETLRLTERLTVNAAVRADVFTFDFRGLLYDTTALALRPLRGRTSRARVSPKLNLYYQLTPAVQLFARSGFGFHSNDARGVIRGTGADNVLPRALGYEVGSTFKVGPSLVVNTALWALHLQDELVYVGDAAEVESSGPTRRFGLDVAARYQLTRVLFADLDLNYNHGRQVQAPAEARYIPLAPSFTSIGGLTLKQPGGLSASLRYRHLNDRPANDDGSIRAKGYFLLDAVLSYTKARFQVGATAENLLNATWNQAQFATETRLPNEAQPVDELHFTPGTPFFLKLNASVFF